MRKLFLSLVFVLACGVTFMNANAVEKEATLVNNENVQYEEDFGCASDCVWGARQWALARAEDHDNRGAGGELMEQYNFFYGICIEGC
jgi:hypothetical protein